MSNGINHPQGLQIVQSAIGNGGTQKLGTYQIYADPTGQTTQPNSIYSGDPVKWVSAPGLKAMTGTIAPQFLTSTADNNAPAIATAEADAFVGVFISCRFIDANGKLQELPYWPGGQQVMAGTSITAYVNDDPMAVFNIQVSSSLANNNGIIFLQNQCGFNAKFGVGGINFTEAPYITQQNPQIGNPVSGSAYYLDGNSTAITVGLDVKIIGLAPTTNLNPIAIPALIPGSTAPFVNVLVKFNKHIYGSVGVNGPTAGADPA